MNLHRTIIIGVIPSIMVALPSRTSSATVCWLAFLLVHGIKNTCGFSPPPPLLFSPARLERKFTSGGNRPPLKSPWNVDSYPHQFGYPTSHDGTKQHQKPTQLEAFSNQRAWIDASQKDFKKGALRIHENYWDLYWTTYIRGALISLSVSIAVALAHTASPDLGFKAVSFLSNNLLLVSNVVSLLFVVPLLLLFSAPFEVIEALPESSFKAILMKTVGLPLRGVAVWVFGAASSKMTMVERGAKNPLMFIMIATFVTPVVEEIVFRRFLTRLLKRVMKRPHKDNMTGMEEGDRKDLSPWAITSSAIFAASHIANWVGPLDGLVLSDDESLVQALSHINRALMHSYVAFMLSVRVFTPMFEDFSVAGSIGAHVVWNACALTNTFIQLPVRGTARVWHWTKSKLKKPSS